MIEQDIQTILQRLDNIERLLLKLEKAAAPPKPPSKWMTVNGAAKQLGLRNGYQIRNLITKKVIGVADLGGKGIYVDTESLYQYLEGRRRQTQEDIDRGKAQHIINQERIREYEDQKAEGEGETT